LSNHHGLSNALLKPNPDVSEYMWKPEIESLAGLFSDGDNEEVTEHVQPTGIGNLHVVTSGPPPPNPADLLGSERMEAIIEELKKQADVVLFDSPPVLAVTDAAVLSTRVDGVLLVNDARRTRRAMARRAVEGLRQVDANLLGVVLNRLPARRGGFYYSQYYDDQRKKRRQRQRHSRPSISQLLLGKIKLSGNHRQGPAQRQLADEPEPVTKQR